MAARGTRPKPTATLKATGAFRPDRHGDRPDAVASSLPFAAVPDCPAWLSANARAHWHEVAEMMDGLNVLAVPHTVSLACLVEALADWIRYVKESADAPLVVTGSAGQDRPNPLLRAKGEAWDRLMRACREFGMTPSAVGSVKMLHRPAHVAASSPQKPSPRTPPLDAFKIA